MKNRPTILALALAGAFTFSAVAGDREKRPDGEKPRRDGDGVPREILKKFDADGDGKLNEAERAAAKKAMGEHRKDGDGVPAEILKKFDTDGDGKLSEAERAAAKKAMGDRREGDGPHPELLKKFDTDGDGKLSEEERAAAKKAMGEREREMKKKRDGDK